MSITESPNPPFEETQQFWEEFTSPRDHPQHPGNIVPSELDIDANSPGEFVTPLFSPCSPAIELATSKDWKERLSAYSGFLTAPSNEPPQHFSSILEIFPFLLKETNPASQEAATRVLLKTGATEEMLRLVLLNYGSSSGKIRENVVSYLKTAIDQNLSDVLFTVVEELLTSKDKKVTSKAVTGLVSILTSLTKDLGPLGKCAGIVCEKLNGATGDRTLREACYGYLIELELYGVQVGSQGELAGPQKKELEQRVADARAAGEVRTQSKTSSGFATAHSTPRGPQESKSPPSVGPPVDVWRGFKMDAFIAESSAEKWQVRRDAVARVKTMLESLGNKMHVVHAGNNKTIPADLSSFLMKLIKTENNIPVLTEVALLIAALARVYKEELVNARTIFQTLLPRLRDRTPGLSKAVSAALKDLLLCGAFCLDQRLVEVDLRSVFAESFTSAKKDVLDVLADSVAQLPAESGQTGEVLTGIIVHIVKPCLADIDRAAAVSLLRAIMLKAGPAVNAVVFEALDALGPARKKAVIDELGDVASGVFLPEDPDPPSRNLRRSLGSSGPHGPQGTMLSNSRDRPQGVASITKIDTKIAVHSMPQADRPPRPLQLVQVHNVKPRPTNLILSHRPGFRPSTEEPPGAQPVSRVSRRSQSVGGAGGAAAALGGSRKTVGRVSLGSSVDMTDVQAAVPIESGGVKLFGIPMRQRREEDERRVLEADEEQLKSLWRGVGVGERVVDKMFRKQRWGEVVEILRNFKELVTSSDDPDKSKCVGVRDLLFKWMTWIFGLCKENPQVLKAVYELLDAVLESTVTVPLSEREQQILLPTLFERFGTRSGILAEDAVVDLMNRHFLRSSTPLVTPAGLLQHLTAVISTTKNRRTLVACFQLAALLAEHGVGFLTAKGRRDLLRMGVVVHWQNERGIRDFVTTIGKSIASVDEITFLAVVKDPAVSHDLRNMWLVHLNRWRCDTSSVLADVTNSNSNLNVNTHSSSKPSLPGAVSPRSASERVRPDEQFGQMTPEEPSKCPTPRCSSSSPSCSSEPAISGPAELSRSPDQCPQNPAPAPADAGAAPRVERTPVRECLQSKEVGEFMTANSRIRSPMKTLKAVREARKRQLQLRPSVSVLFTEEDHAAVRTKVATCWREGLTTCTEAVKCFGQYLVNRGCEGCDDGLVDLISEAADTSAMWTGVRCVEDLENIFRVLVKLLQDGGNIKLDRVNMALVKIINAAELPFVLEALLRLPESLGDTAGKKIVDVARAKAVKLIHDYLRGYQGERNLALLLGVVHRCKSSCTAEIVKAAEAVVGAEKITSLTRRLTGTDENAVS